MRNTLILLVILNFSNLSFAAIPKGDALIIDGTSGILSCTGIDQCAAMTNKANSLAQGITYVMPDYMGIVSLPKEDEKLSSLTSYNTCTFNQKPGSATIINVAKALWGTEIDSPMLGSGCINGSAVNQNLTDAGFKVLPMFSGNAALINLGYDGPNGEKKPTTINYQRVQNLAKLIANTINNDPNTVGVAFDLEGPSIGAATLPGGGVNPKANAPIDPHGYAAAFVTTLANSLQASPNLDNNQRFIAIFDGEHIMYKMKKDGVLPPNVVLMHALYDAGECYDPNRQTSPGKAFEACPVDGDGGYNTKGATPNLLEDVPVLYVLPAAATTQLYEAVQVYNTHIPESVINIKKPKSKLANLPYNDLTSLACLETIKPINIGIQTRICEPVTPPTKENPTYNCAIDSYGPPATQKFVAGCKRYQNPTSPNKSLPIMQIDYFNASLEKLNNEINNKKIINNDNVIGVALYNVKPDMDHNLPMFQSSIKINDVHFNTILAAKGYYNIDATLSTLDYKVEVFPTTITGEIWQAFNDFRAKNPIKANAVSDNTGK